MANWPKFFGGEDEIVETWVSPTDIERIRTAMPKLSAAPPGKIDEAWRAFSTDQYCAGYLILTDDYIEEFREWLGLPD